MLKLAVLFLLPLLVVGAIGPDVQDDIVVETAAYEEAAEEGKCDDEKFKRCGLKFAKQLGIQPGPVQDTYPRRVFALQFAFGTKDGLRKICSAHSRLRRCVGPSIAACTTVRHLMKQRGLSKEAAIKLATTFHKKQYECDNFREVTKRGTYECLALAVLDEKVPELIQCVETAKRQGKEHPELGCKIGQQYDDCVTNALVDKCGRRVRRLVCESVAIDVRVRAPQCAVRCGRDGNDESPDRQPLRPFTLRKNFHHEQHIANYYSTWSQREHVEDSCDVDRLKRCAAAGKRTLGLHSDDVIAALTETAGMMQTKSGFSRVCGVMKTFEQCCGAEDVKLCFDMQTLMNDVHLSPVAAVSANMSFLLADFECNHQVFVDKYECLKELGQRRKVDLQKCAHKFEQIAEQHPGHPALCKALGEYETCVKDIYNECGDEAGVAVCQLVEKLVVNTTPEAMSCPIQCDSTAHHGAVMRRIVPNSVDVQHAMHRATDADDNGSCDVVRFKQCGKNFRKELGVTGQGVASLLTALKRIVDTQGKRGFLKICSAGSRFDRCAGAQVDACFQYGELQRDLHITKLEAIMLNATRFSLQFECGHKVFADNFECLQRTQQRKQAVLEGCGKRFEKEMMHHGLPCKASQHLLDCVSSPFKHACGRPAGVGVCQFYMAYLKAYVPHVSGCPMHCDI